MSIPANRRNITAEELLQHPEWGPCELVEGEVVPVSPTKRRHVKIAIRVILLLSEYRDKIGRGFVGGTDGGIIVARHPDTVREPDVYFTWVEGDLDNFETVPPELCVEVLSDSNTRRNILTKTREFLDFGVKLVWIVDPKERSVQIFRRDGTSQVLGETETLTGEDVLEGLLIPIEKLFN